MNNALYDKIVNGLEKVEKLQNNTVKAQFATDNATAITYEDLANAPFDIWTGIDDQGVRFKRVKHPSIECFYVAELDPAMSKTNIASLNWHFHDCKEVGKVIEGHLIEASENFKLYEVGDTFIFPAYHTHKSTATVKSIYEVEFIKPQINEPLQ